VTITEWEERAEEHRLAGEPLRIGPDEYAALVRLRLAHDPLDMADHTTHLFGVPLLVDV
jgi:hypothetical protein